MSLHTIHHRTILSTVHRGERIEFVTPRRRLQPGRAPIFLIDQDITFDLRYARQSGHATLNTFIAEDRDAAIFRRLL